ncbi:MAG TPA: hypothetical protein VIR01_11770, partial [Pyrinomonadaceae bacterium]
MSERQTQDQIQTRNVEGFEMLSAQQIVADGNSAAQVIEEKCGSSSIARNKKPPFEYWVVDLAVKVALPESVGPLSLAR